MKKGNPEPLSARLAGELRQLEATDDAPDTTAMPEVTDWAIAERGRFYRPLKKQKTLRIDADVLAYFEAQGPGYLTRMNQVLRESMLQALRRGQTEQGADRPG